jgi:uncharacterized membrane protein YhaH (DUF805 family)
MKWIRFFCNFEGRIPRKTFWPANIAVFVLDVIVVAIAAAAAEAFAGESAGHATMHVVTVAFFYPQFVIALKRAHDLDMSNLVIYAWYVALAVDYGIIRLAVWLWSNFRPEHLFTGRAGICPGVHHRRRSRHPCDADRAWLSSRHARAE